jgi:hypothetical protein
MVEYRQEKTTDSSTRILWKSYKQSHLVTTQEELGEGNYEFGLRNIFVHTSKWFLTCRKISRHGANGFISPPKKDVL